MLGKKGAHEFKSVHIHSKALDYFIYLFIFLYGCILKISVLMPLSKSLIDSTIEYLYI